MEQKRYNAPELLAPVGDMERLISAVRYGADAVYLAGKSFGMRSAPSNFTNVELEEAVKYCHAQGVKVYVTCNILPHNAELAALPAFLEFCQAIGVDAFIMTDLGVMAMAKKYAPNVAIHISTQAGVVNYETANAFYNMGAERVVLARELSFEEIAEIRAKTPKALEIEAFVHGAMCVSFSGRCLLSNYMTGRDANHGDCAQPCRWDYYLIERTRPDQVFTIEQDQKSTYVFNSRDMCMIDHLDDIMDAGIDCIKIEGRAKSAYYAAIVTGAYRHVLDDVAAGRKVDPVWRDEVEHVSHRHYSTGFYYGQPGQYYDNSRYIRDWQVCAVVTDCDADGNATLSLRNKFAAGDEIELVGPDSRPFTMTAPVMHDLEGFELYEPRTPQTVFKMKLPRYVPPMSFVRHAVSLSAKD